ncbi:hypothetical protein ACFZCV_34325 [Streptomyces sp. NPDC007920]|uniref:hypothetical protein n=1 Tax=Streptomyces sp. NPDC007920 TaxID=3364794 RepID=UPI0036EEE8C3
MDGGALADDGAVAAVVIDSARQVVWACRLNAITWAPEEITLPDELQPVPATGEDGRTDWLHRWEQHITSPR